MRLVCFSINFSTIISGAAPSQQAVICELLISACPTCLSGEKTGPFIADGLLSQWSCNSNEGTSDMCGWMGLNCDGSGFDVLSLGGMGIEQGMLLYIYQVKIFPSSCVFFFLNRTIAGYYS